MEDSPSKRASQKWSAVIPKIWKIADAENNPNIVAVLDELEDSIEEGIGEILLIFPACILKGCDWFVSNMHTHQKQFVFHTESIHQ